MVVCRECVPPVIDGGEKAVYSAHADMLCLGRRRLGPSYQWKILYCLLCPVPRVSDCKGSVLQVANPCPNLAIFRTRQQKVENRSHFVLVKGSVCPLMVKVWKDVPKAGIRSTVANPAVNHRFFLIERIE
jgi:hypothetical protein